MSSQRMTRSLSRACASFTGHAQQRGPPLSEPRAQRRRAAALCSRAPLSLSVKVCMCTHLSKFKTTSQKTRCVCVCVCSICRHTQWDTAYQTFFIHSSSMDIKLLLCFLSVEITSFASMWTGLEIVNSVTIVNYCQLDGKRQI